MSAILHSEGGAGVREAGATLKQPSFVVFSDDWGEHKSSSQHLFNFVREQHAVLWVNTIGMRRPRLNAGDFRKALRKLSKMLDSSATPAGPIMKSHLTVSQPRMLPFTNISAVRRWNARSVIGEVRRQMGRLGLTRPVVVATVPNACDYVGELDASRVVYYCVDDFSAWPGLDSELVRAMENKLVARSDIILAASPTLRGRLAQSGKPTYLLPHGVDVELFSREVPFEHGCLTGIRAPRVGFFGLFDERSDQELIAALAGRMPGLSFVIAGPIETSTSLLRACPNIHFTGRIPYGELPSFISGLQALFIPYRADAFADTLAPLKLKEYLATGKPVVSTPIAAACALADCISIAASLDEWEAALRNALTLQIGPRREQMRRRLADDSWARRAETLVAFCGAGATAGEE